MSMTGLAGSMPEGRRGQLAALALLAGVLGVLWVAAAAPLVDWYGARAADLAGRRLLLAHMEQLVAALPALRREAGKVGADAPPATALLQGAADSIAGATLQSVVQDLAGAAGATLASSEALPGEQQGRFRRIALRVTVRGDWLALVTLLRAVDDSKLRLLVASLELHATSPAGGTGSGAMEASFVVQGFRAGTETPG